MPRNIFDAFTTAIVNPVNCVGVAGKGLALEFRHRYPANFNHYLLACQDGSLVPGKCLLTRTRTLVGPQVIVNFPTKLHWRDPSKLEWIESGLVDCAEQLLHHSRVMNVDDLSITFPAIGCGLGGLDWKVVKPMRYRTFRETRIQVETIDP